MQIMSLNVPAEWLRKVQFKISTDRWAMIVEVSRVFLKTSTQIPAYDLKLERKSLIPDSCRFNNSQMLYNLALYIVSCLLLLGSEINKLTWCNCWLEGFTKRHVFKTYSISYFHCGCMQESK